MILCPFCNLKYICKEPCNEEIDANLKEEKPMENKVQMTEEYAREILEQATIIRPKGSMETWINNLKFAGYIRKSAVEEAENIYRSLRYDEKYTADYYNEVIDKLFKAIQELKAKLKKEEK